MSIKLTDTQIVMLSGAAQRDDRCLVAPRKLKGGAAKKVAAKLIGGGLAKEIKAKPGAPVWRRDEQGGQSYALKLTAAGVRAIADRPRPGFGRNERRHRPVRAGHSNRLSDRRGHCRSSCNRPEPVRAPRRHEAGAGPRIASARLWRNAKRTDCGDGLASAYHARCAYGLRKRGYAVTIDRHDKERGSTYRARLGETIETGGATGQSDAPPAISLPCKSKKARTRGEAASATGSVMSQGRRSGDVGESLSLQASSPREAETLDAAVAGLAALDAHQLRLQWRNHLGGAAPTHLPRWLLLRVLAYRLQAAALGDLDKAIFARYSRFARRSDRFRRSSFQQPQANDAGRNWPQLGSAARARVERQTGKGDGARQGLRLERKDLWQPFPSR